MENTYALIGTQIDQSDMVTSPGTPRMAASIQKLGKGKEEVSLGFLEGSMGLPAP